MIERKLGRYLKHSEVVHHINGNRTDNRIENLKLFANERMHRLFHIEQSELNKSQNNSDKEDGYPEHKYPRDSKRLCRLHRQGRGGYKQNKTEAGRAYDSPCRKGDKGN